MTAELRALVVDDDELCRVVARSILLRLGATEVFEAATGAEALAWAETDRGRLDLVLCDLRMPQLDGIETIDKLARLTYPRAFVLASAADPRTLRASAAMTDRTAIRELFVLQKPMTLENMADIVATVRSGRDAPDLETAPQIFQPLDCSTKLMRATVTGEFISFFQPARLLAPAAFDTTEPDTNQPDIPESSATPARAPLRAVHAHLRWNSAAHGLLEPESFADVARTIGLLADIHLAIIPQALEQFAAWRRAGHDFSLKLTLAAPQLLDPDLPRRLEEMVAAESVPADRVVFGITEDAWLQESKTAREVLTRLRVREFGLAIDDFGAGRATFKQLLAAPFTEMKLDPAIVHAAPGDPEAAIVLASNVALARQLGMAVIAPGLETLEQWRFAARAGCDAGTGPLIGRPVAAAEMTAQLAAAQAPGHTPGHPAEAGPEPRSERPAAEPLVTEFQHREF